MEVRGGFLHVRAGVVDSWIGYEKRMVFAVFAFGKRVVKNAEEKVFRVIVDFGRQTTVARLVQHILQRERVQVFRLSGGQRYGAKCACTYRI